MHLSHIAKMFAEGNLNVPMFIHDTTPLGAPVMEKLHDQIHYKFQETEAGAREQGCAYGQRTSRRLRLSTNSSGFKLPNIRQATALTSRAIAAENSRANRFKAAAGLTAHGFPALPNN